MSTFSLLDDVPHLPHRVVVIDVFRSSNTVIELLSRGASRVIPVAEIDSAHVLKLANPDWILLGERRGERLPGCEGDNSPTQELTRLNGATVLLTTGGGTRCIAACGGERKVWLGSFANADALIRRLQNDGDGAVGFWAVGLFGEHRAEEDELCAAWLEARWQGNHPDFSLVLTALQNCSGADRLRVLGQQTDLDYCCRLNTREIVPCRVMGNDGLWGFVQ